MTYDIALERIQAYRNDGLSYRQIADLPQYKGLKPGTICSFAKGNYIPKRSDIRRKLGLPELIVQEVIRDERGRFAPRG